MRSTVAMYGEQSPSTKELNEAISRFQGAIHAIPRSVSGEFGPYSDLEAVWSVIRKPASDCGLAIMQPIVPFGTDGSLAVATTIGHTSGEFIRSVVPMPPGLYGQDLARESAYIARISLVRMLSLPSKASHYGEAEDDDGTTGRKAAEKTLSVAERKKSYMRSLETGKRKAFEAATKALVSGSKDERQKFLEIIRERSEKPGGDFDKDGYTLLKEEFGDA